MGTSAIVSDLVLLVWLCHGEAGKGETSREAAENPAFAAQLGVSFDTG